MLPFIVSWVLRALVKTRYQYERPENEYVTFGELAKQRRDAIVEFEMQKLHDRIILLRDRFKPGVEDD